MWAVLRRCRFRTAKAYEAYLRAAVEHTVKLLLAWTLVPIILVVIGLLAGGIPPIETDLSSGAYLRSDGIISDRFDAIDAAVDYERKLQSSSGQLQRRLQVSHLQADDYFGLEPERWSNASSEEPARRLTDLPVQPNQFYAEWQVDLFYEAKDGLATQLQVLKDIRKLEKRIESLPSYNKLCLVESKHSTNCRELISAMRFLYGTKVSPSNSFSEGVDHLIYPDGNSDEINEVPAVLSAMAEPTAWRQLVGQSGRVWYFDRHFPKSKRMRTRFWFGSPLPGFKNRLEDRGKQAAIFYKFVESELFPVLKQADTDNMKVYYQGGLLEDVQVKETVTYDGLLALASLVLVWGYMTFYTRAPLLATFGMLTVLLGIPVGTILFAMMGHAEFPVINFLALFLLTGIGADHLFILTDAWVQSKAYYDKADLVGRLNQTMSRAGKAIVACGTTTAISFMANLWSSIRPLRMFGEYVGFCVFSNFVLCLGIFPLVLILREGVRREVSASSQSYTGSQDLEQNPVNDPEATSMPAMPAFSQAGPHDGPQAPEFQSRLERFMALVYAPAIRRLRWVFVVAGFLLTAGALVLASQSLQVSRSPPQFFAPGTHNLGDIAEIRGTYGDKTWASDMELLPLQICKGCKWGSSTTDLLPSGCTFLGSQCKARPCAGDPSVADVEACAGYGICNATTGRCNCIDGLTGPDCRVAAGASKQDCFGGRGGEECSGNGVCNRASCWCNVGWKGEFCEFRDRSVNVKDCLWSLWESWSDCSATCGWGQYFRKRKILEMEEDGGKPCEGRPLETKSCKQKDCDVDCSFGNWSDWGDCSVECGDGSRQRDRSVVQEAKGNGASCEGSTIDLAVCNEAPCISCEISQWENDGDCSTSCGSKGVQKMTRTVVPSDPSNPGDCPVGETTQYLPCNRVECPVKCKYGAWREDPAGGGCSATCGEGRVRQVRIASDDECDHEYRTVTCAVSICPSTCDESSYGEWQEWSRCSAECGPSQRSRKRVGPAGCPAEQFEQVQICSTEECPKSCEEYGWVPFGQCSASCGQGQQLEERDFKGETPPQGCPTERAIDCAAGVQCPTDCKLGASWVDVTPCSATCGVGSLQQERQVLQFGAHGGEECPTKSSSQRSRTAECDTNIPCPMPETSPTPTPTSTIEGDPDLHLQLHGLSTLTSAEEAALAQVLSQYLDVPVSDVQLQVKSKGGGRRLQADPLEVSVLVEGTPSMEALNKLQSAINSNSVSSALKNTGFQELTHVVYVPATSPMPSPTPSPASPSPTPSPSSTPSLPSTATPSPGPSPTPPSSPSRSPTGPAGGNKGLQGSSGNDGLPTISEADRSLPGREVARVNIVFGLDSLPPEGVRGQDKGKPVPNTAFNFEDYETQAAMLRICQAAKEMGDRLAIRSTKCFSDDFKIWLNTKGFQYPLPSREVHALLQEFLILRLTLDYDYAAGFSDDLKRVVWVRLEMTTNLPQKMPAPTAWLWKAEWDKFLEEMNRKESSSKSLGAFFHTSTLWVRAETETKLVTTTLLCAVFSIAFALITVVAFLRNLALAVYLVLSIVSVVICLAALMFGIIGWPFGAVEAIGLIVFVGFSVDYSMHLAEAFRQSAGETRFARMKEALQRTGGAIMASAMTSFLAGIPLVFCTIQVFVKFGITVVSNTVLSLLFSLLFFTALLMIAGPMEDPCEVLFSLVRPAKKNDSGDTVPGTVLSPSDGPADEAGGYKWSTGDPNDNNTGKKGEGVDPSEPQKGTPTSPAANESFNNPHLEQPTRVTTPTRRGSNESDDSSLNPVVVGAPQAEAGAL